MTWKTRTHYKNMKDALVAAVKRGATHRDPPWQGEEGPPFYVYRQRRDGQWEADHLWGFPHECHLDNQWFPINLDDCTSDGKKLWQMIPIPGAIGPTLPQEESGEGSP